MDFSCGPAVMLFDGLMWFSRTRGGGGMGWGGGVSELLPGWISETNPSP